MNRQIEDIEANGLAIEVLKHLDGLTVAQAQWVLKEADSLLRSRTRLDISGPDFSATIEEYEAAMPCNGCRRRPV